MNPKLKHFFIIFLILLFAIQVQADAPINYNKELASDVELRGTFFTNDNADGFYVSLIGENSIQIVSDIHHIDKTIKMKKTALDSRFKKFNGINIGITHISDNGIVNNYISPVVVDGEFVYITVDFSTVIINGMTGTTTTTLTGLSGNQSISVIDGSSYDLNITNNQEGVWASSDGRNYQNKSIITINGSMVTTESQIPLQLFTNLEGVNGTGDIGIAYTNLTAIPREIEYVWDSDNVSLHFPFNTTSGVDSQFVVLWGSDNNTEPAANSTYGSEAVWDSNTEAAYLMNNDPSGSAPQLLDSTSNNINQTSYGSMTSEDLVDGDYEKGIDFDNSNDYFDSSNTTILNGNDAISFTVKFNRTAGIFSNIIAKFQYNNNQRQFGVAGDANDKFRVYLSSTGSNYPTTQPTQTISDGVYIISFIWDKDIDSGYGTIFINGIEITSYDEQTALTSVLYSSNEPLRIGRQGSATYPRYSADTQYYITLSNVRRSVNYIITTHKNLNNPTASGTDPFYLSVGEEQTASGTLNITASVTGDSNEQSYNASQSREFTLTPTGTTNNVLINTTSTDYDVLVTTYWTDDTTQYSQTSDSGYVKSYINYTPSFPITTAIFNDTINWGVHNFSNDDYVGNINTTINGSYISAMRDGQEINATAYNLINSIYYWINSTIPYNNIPTVGAISDIESFLGVPYSFSPPSYSDPEGLVIDSELWKFGDGDTSSSSNPSHIYTTVGDFNANYSVTETATVSPQTILREFNVSVEVQPVQNLTSTPDINHIHFDWDNYSSADYWNISRLDITIPFTPAYPILDGIEDAYYECCCAYGFVGDAPNPYTDYGKELIYILRNSTYLMLYADGEDNDGLNNDDNFLIGIDASNNNLSTDDRKFILNEGGTVTAKRWSGSAWLPIATNAQGAVVGGGTPGAIQYEMFIPVSELDTNFTNTSTVKFFMSRTHTASTPDIESYYPQTLINTTDATLWQSVLLSSEAQYTYINNTTISEYTVSGLDQFTWYQHQFTAINGSQESSSVDSSDITSDVPSYSISGYIKDISGNSIANADVWGENGYPLEHNTSNASGYYIGTHFHNGTYTIYANATGYLQNNSGVVTVIGANLTNVNITLIVEEEEEEPPSVITTIITTLLGSTATGLISEGVIIGAPHAKYTLNIAGIYDLIFDFTESKLGSNKILYGIDSIFTGFEEMSTSFTLKQVGSDEGVNSFWTVLLLFFIALFLSGITNKNPKIKAKPAATIGFVGILISSIYLGLFAIAI